MTPPSPLRVLHLVASRDRRGGETFASDLVGTLADLDQRVAVLRGGQQDLRFSAPTRVLATGRARLPWLDPGAVLRLRRVIDSWRPDVVQAHGGEPLKYAAYTAAGVPVVYRKIGMSAPWARSGFRRALHSRILRRATRVVAVTEEARREVVDVFGVPEGRTLRISNAVDQRRLEPGRSRSAVREELGVLAEANLVLSVGAFTWEKDPLGHIEVMGRAVAEAPGTVLAMAGSGRLLPRAGEAIRRRGLERSILLLGPRSDVPDLLSAADVLLLASATEGMPACVIEAGMASLPVAAFAHPGIREVVEDGTTGRLAPSGDRAALARCVVDLVRNRGRREAMGRSAAQRCRTLFDIRAVAPRYAELYAELAGVRLS